MILCLTPNPAVDRTVYVPSIQLGEVHRATRTLTAAGGKGLNAARTIRTLGSEPFCMGPIGGYTGDLLADLARREGLSAQWTRIKNETRMCMILVQEGQDATVINESGAGIAESECDSLMEDVCRQAANMDIICSCGSLLPGFSKERYKSLLLRLVAMGRQVWLDTSGEALRAALDVPGVCIKVNAAELSAAVDQNLSTSKSVLKAMRHLRDRGISQVAVTLGKDGGVLQTSEGVWSGQPPKIDLVSSVGSGDAFLGGLLFSLEKNTNPETALRNAVAAGAANALKFGGGKFSLDVFLSLREEVKISTLE